LRQVKSLRPPLMQSCLLFRPKWQSVPAIAKVIVAGRITNPAYTWRKIQWRGVNGLVGFGVNTGIGTKQCNRRNTKRILNRDSCHEGLSAKIGLMRQKDRVVASVELTDDY
jgi:predicted membrane-bound mannosyltransferase